MYIYMHINIRQRAFRDGGARAKRVRFLTSDMEGHIETLRAFRRAKLSSQGYANAF